MISLNEISTLVQRLESIIVDSEHGVFGINVNSGHTHVHLEAITFLTEFIEYDIEVDGDENYPYELKAKIAGVKFIAMMSVADVVDLKDSIPKQWEYIQEKLQIEPNGGEAG